MTVYLYILKLKIINELNNYIKFLKIIVVKGHTMNPYIFGNYLILKTVTQVFVIKLIVFSKINNFCLING